MPNFLKIIPRNYSSNLPKNILIDFFEERSEEVTSGILERWVAKHQEMEELRKLEGKLKSQILSKTLEKSLELRKFSSFGLLKQNSEQKAQEELK